MKQFFKKEKVLMIILALALLVRLSYLFILEPPLIWVDSSDYDQTGLSLSQGRGYVDAQGKPFAYREPGYALFFLAPVYFVFGHSILAVQLFQIFLSLAIALFIFYLANKYFSRKTALLAVALFAFYPPFIAYCCEVLTEIPAAFLLIAAVFLIVKMMEKQSFKMAFLAGVVLGMLVLTRFIFVFLPPFLLVFFLLLRDWRRYTQYLLVSLVVLLLVLFPWFLRNYLVFDTFIFGRTSGGEALWEGSYVPWQGEHQLHLYPAVREELVGGLDEIEVNKKWNELAIENITTNPWAVFKVWLRKPGRLFLKSEFEEVLNRENKFAEFFKSGQPINSLLAARLLTAFNIFILLFALLGFLPALRKNPLAAGLLFLFVFYFLLVHLPAIPDARYKLPAMPYLMIFASVGAFWLFERIKKLRPQLNRA